MSISTSEAASTKRAPIHGHIAARIDRLPLTAVQWRLAILVTVTWGFIIFDTDGIGARLYPFVWRPRNIITVDQYAVIQALRVGLGILLGAYLMSYEQFEHFASNVTVRRHYNGETIDTSDVVIGSGGDTGIDGIAIIVNGSVVSDVESLEEHADLSGNFDVTFVFVQAERSSSFDASKIGNFGFGVRDFFESTPRLVRNQKVTELAEVMATLYRQGTKFKPDNPACRLYYVTTGNWVGDANLDARRNAVMDDLRSMQIFRDVDFECVGASGVQKLYRQTKNVITREFVFASRTLIPDIEGVSEAYLGFIPMSEFLNIVSDESSELMQSFFTITLETGRIIMLLTQKSATRFSLIIGPGSC